MTEPNGVSDAEMASGSSEQSGQTEKKPGRFSRRKLLTRTALGAAGLGGAALGWGYLDNAGRGLSSGLGSNPTQKFLRYLDNVKEAFYTPVAESGRAQLTVEFERGDELLRVLTEADYDTSSDPQTVGDLVPGQTVKLEIITNQGTDNESYEALEDRTGDGRPDFYLRGTVPVDLRDKQDAFRNGFNTRYGQGLEFLMQQMGPVAKDFYNLEKAPEPQNTRFQLPG